MARKGPSASLPGHRARDSEPGTSCGLYTTHPGWVGEGYGMEAAACLGERYPLAFFPLAARPKGQGREEEGGYRSE